MVSGDSSLGEVTLTLGKNVTLAGEFFQALYCIMPFFTDLFIFYCWVEWTAN